MVYKQSIFGTELMRGCSVGGKGPNTNPLPEEGCKGCQKSYLSVVSGVPQLKFEAIVWSKCKTALNHSGNRSCLCKL